MPAPVTKYTFWVATHLGQFPQGTTVDRQSLRDMAAELRRTPGDHAVRRSRHVYETRVERRAAIATHSNGAKSTKELGASLKELEDLGFIRRDAEADTVTVLNPHGLRRLAELRDLEKENVSSRRGPHGGGIVKVPVEEQPPFRVPHPDGQPFMIFCSRNHKTRRLLHRGVLVAKADGSPEIVWVVQGQTGEPQIGPSRDDGDYTVSLRCGDRRVCGLERKFSMSGLATAVASLAKTGLKDRKGRVCLDIAQVSYSFDNWPPPEAGWVTPSP